MNDNIVPMSPSENTTAGVDSSFSTCNTSRSPSPSRKSLSAASIRSPSTNERIPRETSTSELFKVDDRMKRRSKQSSILQHSRRMTASSSHSSHHSTNKSHGYHANGHRQYSISTTSSYMHDASSRTTSISSMSHSSSPYTNYNGKFNGPDNFPQGHHIKSHQGQQQVYTGYNQKVPQLNPQQQLQQQQKLNEKLLRNSRSVTSLSSHSLQGVSKYPNQSSSPYANLQQQYSHPPHSAIPSSNSNVSLDQMAHPQMQQRKQFQPFNYYHHQNLPLPPAPDQQTPQHPQQKHSQQQQQQQYPQQYQQQYPQQYPLQYPQQQALQYYYQQQYLQQQPAQQYNQFPNQYHTPKQLSPKIQSQQPSVLSKRSYSLTSQNGLYYFPNGEVFRPRQTPKNRSSRPQRIQRNSHSHLYHHHHHHHYEQEDVSNDDQGQDEYEDDEDYEVQEQQTDADVTGDEVIIQSSKKAMEAEEATEEDVNDDIDEDTEEDVVDDIDEDTEEKDDIDGEEHMEMKQMKNHNTVQNYQPNIQQNQLVSNARSRFGIIPVPSQHNSAPYPTVTPSFHQYGVVQANRHAFSSSSSTSDLTDRNTGGNKSNQRTVSLTDSRTNCTVRKEHPYRRSSITGTTSQISTSFSKSHMIGNTANMIGDTLVKQPYFVHQISDPQYNFQKEKDLPKLPDQRDIIAHNSTINNNMNITYSERDSSNFNGSNNNNMLPSNASAVTTISDSSSSTTLSICLHPSMAATVPVHPTVSTGVSHVPSKNHKQSSSSSSSSTSVNFRSSNTSPSPSCTHDNGDTPASSIHLHELANIKSLSSTAIETLNANHYINNGNTKLHTVISSSAPATATSTNNSTTSSSINDSSNSTISSAVQNINAPSPISSTMTSSSSSSSSPLGKLANNSLPPLSQNKGKLQDLKTYSKNSLKDTQIKEEIPLNAMAEKQKNTSAITNLEESTITSASSKTTLISPLKDADANSKNTKTHNRSSLLTSPERGKIPHVHDYSEPTTPNFQQGTATKESSATSSRRNSITSRKPSVFKNAIKKLFNGSSTDLSNPTTDSNTLYTPKARTAGDRVSAMPSNRNETKPSNSRTNSNKDFKSASLSNMFQNAYEEKQKPSPLKPAKTKFQWGRKSADLKKKLSMDTISPFANKNNSSISIKISEPHDFQKISADTQSELEIGTKPGKDGNDANQEISLVRAKSLFEELKVDLDDNDMFADLLPSFGELDIDAHSFELGDDKEKGTGSIMGQKKLESPKPELRGSFSQETLKDTPRLFEENRKVNSIADIDSLAELNPVSFQLNLATPRDGSSEDVNTEYDLGTDLDYLSSVIGLGETEFFNTLETVKDADRRKSIRIKSLEKKKSLSRTNTIKSQGSSSSSIITSKTTASTVRSFELEETSYDNLHYNKGHELAGNAQMNKAPSSPEFPQSGQVEVITTNILRIPHKVESSKGCLKSSYVDPNSAYNYHAHRSPYVASTQYNPTSQHNFAASTNASSTASSSVPLSPSESNDSLSSSVYPTPEGSIKNSNLLDPPMKKSVSFSSKIYLNETHSGYDYDRFNLSLKRTYHMLNTNPSIVKDIRIELNNFKKTMPIHDLSRRNTHFFMT